MPLTGIERTPLHSKCGNASKTRAGQTASDAENPVLRHSFDT